MTKLNKTFIIRHKDTKDVWTASSGKTSWRAIGHAKNAWINSYQRDEFKRDRSVDSRYSWKENVKFDEQNVYEIVELKPESDIKLQEAINLLRLCALNIGDNKTLSNSIKGFIEDNEV